MQNSTTLLNREQTMKALGVSSIRSIQLLVKQGRLDRKSPPGEPTGGPRKRNECYTSESVQAELDRRKAGIRIAGSVLTPAVAMQLETAASGPNLAVAQIDAFQAIAAHLVKLSAAYPPQLPAHPHYPPGAFLTLKEAAEWKRRPAAWVKNQCITGRLKHERTARGGFAILMRDLEELQADCSISAVVTRNAA